ncbi:MAG: adenylyltransferase/cytidyltransferase family protein [Candidatus Hodarchaeota archaeon]
MNSEEKEKIVMVAGTFDLIHPGHLHLIQEAANLGKVVVVVGRDKNVEELKGKKPVIPEDQRLYMVSALKGVHKAVLGNESTDFTKIIKEISPDIILLGPDQSPSNDRLEKMLNGIGLDITIRRFKLRVMKFPLSSTSAIIQKIKEMNDT